MDMMASPFPALFDFDEIAPDVFRGHGPATKWQRVFGGLVVSQAQAAATRTIGQDRAIHSMHAYFILPGDPSMPIDYEVTRLRDGRSFSTRYCKAMQNGQTIFVLTASYHVAETGLEHARPMPDVAQPETLADFFQLQTIHAPGKARRIFEYFSDAPALDIRPVDARRYYPDDTETPRPAVQNTWFRTLQPLPDDRRLHEAVLAYASDMTLLDCAVVPHFRSVIDGTLMPASLDHTIWFHRPFRADEWLLYAQESPNANAARGLSFGYIYSRGGDLVATIAQEGLIRLKN